MVVYCFRDSNNVIAALLFSRLLLLRGPSPSCDIRAVDAVLVGIAATGNLRVTELFLSVAAYGLQLRHTINGVHRQTETVNLIVNGEFHWGVDIAFLFVAGQSIVPSHRHSVKAMGLPQLEL